MIYRSQVEVLARRHCIVAFQATYTCVPLSPSSIIWYRPRGSISLAGKISTGLVVVLIVVFCLVVFVVCCRCFCGLFLSLFLSLLLV